MRKALRSRVEGMDADGHRVEQPLDNDVANVPERCAHGADGTELYVLWVEGTEGVERGPGRVDGAQRVARPRLLGRRGSEWPLPASALGLLAGVPERHRSCGELAEMALGDVAPCRGLPSNPRDPAGPPPRSRHEPCEGRRAGRRPSFRGVSCRRTRCARSDARGPVRTAPTSRTPVRRPKEQYIDGVRHRSAGLLDRVLDVLVVLEAPPDARSLAGSCAENERGRR